MNTILKSFLIIGAAFAAITCAAKEDIKRPDSYNFNRGVETYCDGDYDEAYYYLQKEVADNPKNGYAFIYLSLAASLRSYGEALTYANKSIKLIPKKDKEYLSYAYGVRSDIYLELNDTVKALADLTTAIGLTPEDTDLYDKRGRLYLRMREYDKSVADFTMLIKLDEASLNGYHGLALSALGQQDYQLAIDLCDKAIKLYPSYNSTYAIRSLCYSHLNKYNEAADDLIYTLKLSDNISSACHDFLYSFDDDAVPLVKAKLRIEAQKSPQNPIWQVSLGFLLRFNSHQYAEAAQYFLKANELSAHPDFLESAAECYGKLGNYTKAIELLTNAQNISPDNAGLIWARAEAYGDAWMLKECLAEWQRYIDINPDYYGGYFQRGVYESYFDMTDQAIEDFSMSIILEPSFAPSYFHRADMYWRQGKTDLAMADYQKVTQLDTVPTEGSIAMFALFALGRKEEATDFMENVIEQDSLNCYTIYNGACFYSILGDEQKAISMMKKCLELGFVEFSMIEHDYQLDPIRDTEEFKELIDTYRRELDETTEINDVYEDEVVEVPFTKEGGVTKVKCQINGLPLHFVFDTGAADVTLSMVEANFMMKNEYISEDDILGSSFYMDANGDISEGTIINLKSVNFGGLELTNVKASVVKNQRAPLLLGQSVLGRLGKIEIDNPGMKLKITHPVKK